VQNASLQRQVEVINKVNASLLDRVVLATDDTNDEVVEKIKREMEQAYESMINSNQEERARL
jgi:mannose/fructose-specific phosphotransferase system component IIA